MPALSWSVDYGSGPQPITFPHAWRQDVPVSWEGPAVYRTALDVPVEKSWLLFERVSYAATVRLNGQPVKEHRGIYTAFSVDLSAFAGQRVEVEVEVTKNGGETYPVDEVASGFIPFVFHTFGGIYGDARIVRQDADPALPAPSGVQRVSVEGSRIYVDGSPFYSRGVLTWGWYPELGHQNPPSETIEEEIAQAKELGFNLIKFCLWAPPHEYLKAMNQQGMMAWLELPLWDPTQNEDKQRQIWSELEEIVLQYRRHDNIILWTVGCELNQKVAWEDKRRLYQMVKMHTGSPLVKDNSGSAEMYGGDPREAGDFDDFHPYCETHFYPLMLDSLLPGPRPPKPILLGEFNDFDVHRDLPRLLKERPYWISEDVSLNAQGVRWQHDMPRILARSHPYPICRDQERSDKLRESSRRKSLFVRKFVQEAVRAREEISGFVVTGWRDTPISSSGVFDGWNEPKFTGAEFGDWNSGDCIFLIPQRRPPWIDGGNRPGWAPTFSFFSGDLFWRFGVHSEGGAIGRLEWQLAKGGETVAEGASERSEVGTLCAAQVGEAFCRVAEPGRYTLRASYGDAENSWPIRVYPRCEFTSIKSWSLYDPRNYFDDLKFESGEYLVATDIPSNFGAQDSLLFLTGEGTLPKPFWRECAFEFDAQFWDYIGFGEELDQLLAISPDRALDPRWLDQFDAVEVLMNRVDTRTYAEHPLVAKFKHQGKLVIATTLRPFGGLGICPTGLSRNPAGAWLLMQLMTILERPN